MTPQCQWERFKVTRAPMPSQQRQVMFCPCPACSGARAMHEAALVNPTLRVLNQRVKERFEALQWKPEPEAETDGAA